MTVVGPVAASHSHPLHAADRLWPETNCYADVWIELLHWAGLDPLPLFAFGLGLDWEGDQFTFFKPSHEDLRDLYGIEVQELNPWKSLDVHVGEQVALGRVLLLEADAFWLPDTSGTSYRTSKSKSTIGAYKIDRAARRLWYFHGTGAYVIDGDDYDGALMRRGDQQSERVQVPFVETVKLGRVVRHDSDALARAARAVLVRWIDRMPSRNPFAQFGAAFDGHQQWLLSESMEQFHAYAFATVRQAGACCQLVADTLDWHIDRGDRALGVAREAASTISETCKAMQMGIARATHRRRPYDAKAPLETVVAEWTRLRDTLETCRPALTRS